MAKKPPNHGKDWSNAETKKRVTLPSRTRQRASLPSISDAPKDRRAAGRR